MDLLLHSSSSLKVHSYEDEDIDVKNENTRSRATK